jgi:hypothetical protein
VRQVIGLRRRIAQRWEAKRRVPHFSYVEEVDVTEVEALRVALNAKWQGERARLTLLPLLMRAIVLAVREFPQINALFDDDASTLTRHAAVHIGIATQSEHGLLVPVVRHAEALDLWAAAAEVARLADAARGGSATRDELAGSTITITSLGALGGIVSTPVINRPEVAIVGVNRMIERPTMRGGAVVPRLLMNLSSSFDHRVVDGIDAARFVQVLRRPCPPLLPRVAAFSHRVGAGRAPACRTRCGGTPAKRDCGAAPACRVHDAFMTDPQASSRSNRATHVRTTDLRAASRLAVQATLALTSLVENLHHNILRMPAPLGAASQRPTRGITGLVYRSIRGVTRLVGGSLEALLAQIESLLGPGTSASTPEREAMIAALNGVLGDHLEASGNPLAITMRPWHDGAPLALDASSLARALPAARGARCYDRFMDPLAGSRRADAPASISAPARRRRWLHPLLALQQRSACRPTACGSPICSRPCRRLGRCRLRNSRSSATAWAVWLRAAPCIRPSRAATNGRFA